MSHITTVKAQVKDLNALEAAVKECGGHLVRGQTTFQHYNTAPGKCSHAIKVTGVNYQVGVVESGKDGYGLQFDPYGNGGEDNRHDGQKLVKKFGEKLSRLQQLYAVHKAAIEARKKGWTVARRTLKDGTIQLVATGV